MPFVRNRSGKCHRVAVVPLPLIQFDGVLKGRSNSPGYYFLGEVGASETPEPQPIFSDGAPRGRDLEYSPVPSYARIWAGHVRC
jgi:hypothetical protein